MAEFAQIQSKQDLEKWLQAKKIDITQWGTGTAKSVERLYCEIEQGECRLQMEPPLRVLDIVQLLIYRQDKILVEKFQELSDARRRERNILPSEKMKPGESWQAAAMRCLKEELEWAAQNGKIITSECLPQIRERSSQSYPGLPSCYRIYRVEVELENLPQEDFWTSEALAAHGEQAISRHYWGWMDVKDVKF